jgi:hypothetical protein
MAITTIIRKLRCATVYVGILMILGLSLDPTALAKGASETYCVVVSVNKNAWIVRADSQVKASLRVGDILYEGDKLEVFHGNAVDLSFDKRSRNTVRIEGNSILRLTRILPTSIDLKNGKLYALLDNTYADRRFQVRTPTAIAAVRGTHYQVNVKSGMTEVITYQGQVKVSGRDDGGKATYQHVVLNAGQRTDVRQIGEPPSPATRVNGREMKEFSRVKSETYQIREWVQNGEMGDALPDEKMEKQPKRDRGQEDLDRDEGEGDSDGSKYLL